MSDHPNLRFSENGPIILKGEIKIFDADGNKITKLEDKSFCRCGMSTNKPFCSGAHVAAGFKAPEGLPDNT